jgi:hypothetical protein
MHTSSHWLLDTLVLCLSSLFTIAEEETNDFHINNTLSSHAARKRGLGRLLKKKYEADVCYLNISRLSVHFVAPAQTWHED